MKKIDIELKITKGEIKTGIALSLFAVVVILAVKSVLYFELQYENSLLVIEKPLETRVINNDSFSDLSLSAQSFFIWDIRDKKVLGKMNEETQFPLASLTKLMAVLVVSELSVDGAIITIKPSDLNAENDNGLIVGEKWRLPDIIDFILLTSSNDGARALASVMEAFQDGPGKNTEQKLFVDEMNKKAQQLSMTQSFFLNETGLDLNEAISGAYGSAKDVAILVENILSEYPRLLNASAYEKMEAKSDALVHQINNTNPKVERLPGVVASKTGFTDLAGGNLVVVFDAGINHKIIISVLGSTAEGRFDDMEQLIWACLEKISSI